FAGGGSAQDRARDRVAHLHDERREGRAEGVLGETQAELHRHMSRAARERLAAAIRTLISHAVETDIDPADAQATAERIEQIAGELDRHPRREPKMPKYPHFEDLQINFGD